MAEMVSNGISHFESMEFWDGKSIKQHPPTVEYEGVVSSDDGVKDWLTNIVSLQYKPNSGLTMLAA